MRKEIVGQHSKKEMQNEIHKNQDRKCDIWVKQNLTLRKASLIMSMMEQIHESRAWKEVRELTENKWCRLCKE